MAWQAQRAGEAARLATTGCEESKKCSLTIFNYPVRQAQLSAAAAAALPAIPAVATALGQCNCYGGAGNASGESGEGAEGVGG